MWRKKLKLKIRISIYSNIRNVIRVNFSSLGRQQQH